MHISTFRVFSNDRIATWVLGVVQIVTLLTLAARVSDAQDSIKTRRGTNIVGVSLGVPGYQDQPLPLQLTTVGLSVTHVEPMHVGFDLSVGTVPRLVADGAPIFGARVGVVLPIPVVGQLTLLPGAGISGIGNGDGGELGWNVNLGALAAVSRSTALRTGVSVHQFGEERGAVVWLYELGLAWFVE